MAFWTGHSAGLQLVEVETAKGKIVVASDACHLYEKLHRDGGSGRMDFSPPGSG